MLTPHLTSSDGTAKFLFELQDLRFVESVLVPFANRDAVCLSSQVGCAMKCSFCHTGLMGLARSLSAEEIVQQYQAVKDWLTHERPERPAPNIVFMGQGEPLHNFDAVKEAVLWFTDPRKGKLGPRQITVSTAGYLPGLERFSELGGVNFALSLHSPFDEERSQLIPLNQRWPLDEIFAAIKKLKLRTQQFINCEYLVIKGLNHSAAHARALAERLAGIPAIVNLIPFNSFPGAPWERPSEEEVEGFKRELVAHRLRVFRRTTKGAEILAACGQVNTKELHA